MAIDDLAVSVKCLQCVRELSWMCARSIYSDRDMDVHLLQFIHLTNTFTQSELQSSADMGAYIFQ